MKRARRPWASLVFCMVLLAAVAQGRQIALMEQTISDMDAALNQMRADLSGVQNTIFQAPSDQPEGAPMPRESAVESFAIKPVARNREQRSVQRKEGFCAQHRSEVNV